MKDDQFLDTRIKLTTVFNNLAITGLMENSFYVFKKTVHFQVINNLQRNFGRILKNLRLNEILLFPHKVLIISMCCMICTVFK